MAAICASRGRRGHYADALLAWLGWKAALRTEGIRYPDRFSGLIATGVAVIGSRIFSRFVPLVPDARQDLDRIGPRRD